MPSIAPLLQSGSHNAWLFIPSAILLGALHGLEPGHSKTMMAAFIVAIRGTVRQAIMLGVAATLSHTAVVWAVALLGIYLGAQWYSEAYEGYFQIVSAVMILAVGGWMLWHTWKGQHSCGHDHAHDDDHDHDHDHDHDEGRWLDTGHGLMRIQIFEDGMPACFRIYQLDPHGQHFAANDISIEIERPGGERQCFSFAQGNGYIQSLESIAEPHEFIARIRLGHGRHHHDFDLEFTEAGHAHADPELAVLDLTTPGYQDPHELAHANDIRRRFRGKHVTNGQILVFGLTGGLIPCPASITVLLLCLQLKKVALGAALVFCFSIGLAVTLVSAGVIAAISVHHLSKKWSGFGEMTRRAPLVSGGLICLVGLYIGWQGILALP